MSKPEIPTTTELQLQIVENTNQSPSCTSDGAELWGNNLELRGSSKQPEKRFTADSICTISSGIKA